MIKSLAAACAAIILSSASPALAADLVANGGFEAGNLSNWSTTGNVAIASTPYFGLNSATYGSYVAAFNGGDRAPNGTLSQTIATVGGNAYTLAFDYGVTTGGSQSIIASVFDGTSMALLATKTASSTLTTPQRFSFNFAALSGSSIIRFNDVAANNTASQDGAVDNVSVTAAVPEPATWAMMLMGVGMMGFAMRRSRKSKVSTSVRFA